MRLDKQLVAPDRVNLDDTTYRITTRSDIEDLTASIAQLGILHPPILLPGGDRWTVVAGFRRIAAARQIRLSEIKSNVLPADAPEQLRIELAIADNSLQRPLNLIETARSLQMLSRCQPDLNALAATAATLNLPDNPDLVQKLLRLAELPAAIQQAAADEVIALSMALVLAELQEPIAEEWIRIFRDLQVGLNRQRELLVLVAEIAAREDRTDAEVLHGADIRQILANADTQAAVKYRQLATSLRQRRFPHITAATQRFDDLVKRLDLGPDAHLSPPAHFEGTVYQLRLLFRSPEELRQHVQTIEKMLGSRELKKFLK